MRSIRLEGLIGTGPAGRLRDAGSLGIVPCAVSDIPRLIARRLILWTLSSCRFHFLTRTGITASGSPAIVGRMEAAHVSVPASCTDVVVTEFGAAELRGLPLREARRLLEIAHPRHWAALEGAVAAI